MKVISDKSYSGYTMSNFTLYTANLPCFECHQHKAATSLGWLTPAMHKAVLDQLETKTQKSNEIPDNIVTTITCTLNDAKYYLLLNAFAYSEEEMQDTGVDPDDLAEIEEEISINTNTYGEIKLQHDVALQSCVSCCPEE
jgi:hypothetical protein